MKISAISCISKSIIQPKTKSRFENYSENKIANIPAFYGRELVSQYSREQAIKFLNSNPAPIAEGTDGVIYKLGGFAIKVGKTKDTSFEAEAEILKKLPKNLKNTQKYVDRFNFEQKDVLVSSFVQGVHKKALMPQDFPRVFEVILEHDKENIIHGDLNLGNIMFSHRGEISLIDYGAAYQPTSTEVELYPEFVVNTNALKLENTGLCDSLKEWEKQGLLNENFIKYLASKSSFYSKHSQLLANKTAKEYEDNLARVLNCPSKEVLETELQRINILNLLEMADTAINYDNNPYSAIELWNTTVESAQKYIEKTSRRILESKEQEEQKYFIFQNEIAKSFHTTLSEWRNGTLNWLFEIKNPDFIPKTEVEEKIKNNWEHIL